MLARDLLWDRIAGCLHGLLVGDALGCPVEGWSSEQIAAEFGRLDKMIETPGRKWRPLGLHSDDGQQSLAVLDAICRDPERPELPFVELIVALRDGAPQRAGRFGLHRGVGRNFRATVRGLRINASDPYAYAKPSAGNGAAMRIAPVALWWRDDHLIRDRRVVQLSAVTHTDLRGITAALALSNAIGNVLVPKPPHVLSPRFLTEVEAAEAKAAEQLSLEHDNRFTKLLRALVEDRHKQDSLDEQLRAIARRARSMGGATEDVTPGSAFALCSVLAALVIVDRTRDFESAVTTAINVGDDTDTLGSMVGALAGAKYGLPAIPSAWLDDLRATGLLLERIEQLVERETGPCQPDLLTLEKQWDALYEKRPRPSFG